VGGLMEVAIPSRGLQKIWEGSAGMRKSRKIMKRPKKWGHYGAVYECKTTIRLPPYPRFAPRPFSGMHRPAFSENEPTSHTRPFQHPPNNHSEKGCIAFHLTNLESFKPIPLHQPALTLSKEAYACR
jgi:hypothetical protein